MLNNKISKIITTSIILISVIFLATHLVRDYKTYNAANVTHINPLPVGVENKLIFSHFNFGKKNAELYLLDNQKAKLLVSQKTPNEYIQNYYGVISPDQKKIVYKLSIKDKSDDYPHKIDYDNPAYKDLDYTTNSDLFIANINDFNQKLLLDVKGKEDVPRFIWSDDGKYLFYDLVDYSTQKDNEKTYNQETNVGVWKLDITTGQKTLLREEAVSSSKFFNLYIIGYDQANNRLLVSYNTRGTFDDKDDNEWQIGSVKINVVDPKSNYEVLFSIKGYLGNAPVLMNNNNVIYGLYKNKYSGLSSELNLVNIMTGINKTIMKVDESKGYVSMRNLDNGYVQALYNFGDNNHTEKILDSNGAETSLQLTQLHPEISISPETNFRLERYGVKADPRGLSEYGFAISPPDNETGQVITEDNATFLGWIK